MLTHCFSSHILLSTRPAPNSPSFSNLPIMPISQIQLNHIGIHIVQGATKTCLQSLSPIYTLCRFVVVCPFSRFYHFAIFASASKCSNCSPTISGYLDQIIESAVYTATIHMPSPSGAYELFTFGKQIVWYNFLPIEYTAVH